MANMPRASLLDDEDDSVLTQVWERFAENVAATFSKVTTRIWPLWDFEIDSGSKHVPLIWLMHDVSFPTVLSVRFNDTEVSRQQHTKAEVAQLPNKQQIIRFKYLGKDVVVVVQAHEVVSWGMTSYTYKYECSVDGVNLVDNLAAATSGEVRTKPM